MAKLVLCDAQQARRGALRRVLELEGGESFGVKSLREDSFSLEIDEVDSLDALLNSNFYQYDVIVVTDPPLNEAKLHQSLRESPLSVWVAALSNAEGEREKWVKAGFTMVMDHPLDWNWLLEILRQKTYVPQGGVGPNGVPRGTSELIGIWGSQGGIGKSTLAVNLASVLTQKSGKAMALAEVQPECGLGSFYNKRSCFEIDDLLLLSGSLGANELKKLWIEGERGVLTRSWTNAQALALAEIEIIAGRMRHGVVDWILDGLQGNSNETRGWLRECTKVIVVSNSAPLALKQTELAWRSMRQLLATKPTIYVVANSLQEDWKVNLGEIEQQWEVDGAFYLPHDSRTLNLLWERNRPLSVQDKRSRWGEAVGNLGQRLLEG